MKEEPIVSVVMLTHNREKYVGEAIASVLRQEFTELELILLDDGSTDATAEIIHGFTDARIKYHRFEATGEISRLRNTGISYSTGKFIAFIDSDDVWHAGKLREQVRLLENYPDAGFGFCDVVELKEGKVLRSGLYTHTGNSSEYYGNIFLPLVQNQYVIYPSSAIFKKDCLSKTGWINERLKPGETEFFTRLAYFYNCVISYQVMVNIRKHEGNSSDRLKTETVHEMQYSLHQLYTQSKISKRTFSTMTSWYHYLGGMAYNEKELYVQARREFIRCVQRRPFHVKTWVRILQTFFR